MREARSPQPLWAEPAADRAVMVDAEAFSHFTVLYLTLIKSKGFEGKRRLSLVFKFPNLNFALGFK